MFSKSIKTYPAGTFIATPLRVLAILQLCVAFTILSYYAGYPFMGELFEIKSDKLLYESVMGKEEAQAKVLFRSLPQEQKDKIESDYQTLKSRGERAISVKIQDSIHILLKAIPPFEKAWLTFSIAVSILLLLKIEGATLAAWLLPLIVIAYGADSLAERQEIPMPKEAALFPTEDYLIKNYLSDPLSSNILEQKEQLLHGFQAYLIREWANDFPSTDPSHFDRQAKEGEFYFNLKRIEAKSQDRLRNGISTHPPYQYLPSISYGTFFLHGTSIENLKLNSLNLNIIN